jgi:CRISPR/Cas system CMR subunit Cmr6 (Cas7 group RAMP superfamily)
MIECDGIDKKNNKKCKSPAKYIINIDDKINHRCGRHCRNINNNMVKVKRKSEQNIKIKESNMKEKNENDNIKEILYEVENVYNEKNKKIETLFTKIDKLCELLNDTTF